MPEPTTYDLPDVIALNAFELGQIMGALSGAQFAKLSPELRDKINAKVLELYGGDK